LGNVEIVWVRDRTTRKQFLELPYRLYRDDPHWVPPLRVAQKEIFDARKHPFYVDADAEFLLARRNGAVVGRIAAIHDRNFNRFQEEQAGFFGFFECEQDPEAAVALLGAARDWLAGRGARVVRGPVSPSTNYECGLLVEGFDSSPMVMMPYNPPYYASLIEGAGLRKGRDLWAWITSTTDVAADKVLRVGDRALKNNGVVVRPISMKNFWADVEKVWAVYNSAWARNWGFVPMTREEFLLSGKEMKQILDPELVLLGEVQGRVVGFALALPDINQALKRVRNGRLFPFGLVKILYYGRLITSVRVLALGVIEEYRTAGVAAAFYATLIRNARRLGYGDCEMSWILENNVLMNRSIEAMGGRRYKTYRMYEWD
jgi:GNAT superfamily N-acetyltransferase